MSRAYYNEFDPGAAEWLRVLIKAGLIAPGEVDERSILDVRPADLAGFTQCHFFAGIGGWSLALRLAGWPDDRPVWTGSPPCQPFSVAGEGLSQDDPRHLAPHFVRLVGACRPAMLFGEQVASSEVFGKAANGTRKRAVGTPPWAWIDDLSDRLEAARYAVGASDFPSAGVSAPHIRQRTFFGAVWLGHADGARGTAWIPEPAQWNEGQPEVADDRSGGLSGPVAGRSAAGGLDNSHRIGRPARGRDNPQHDGGVTSAADQDSGMADSDSTRQFPGSHGGIYRSQEGAGPRHGEPERSGADGGLGAAGPWKSYSDWFGCCWHDGCRNSDRGSCDCHTRGAPDGWYWDIHDGWLADAERQQCGGEQRQQPQDGGMGHSGSTSPIHGFWSDADWLFCRDGKWRPVEPGTFPLAHGVSGRVGLLRGYGNAINPHAAAEFIQAFDEAVDGISPA